MELVEAEREPAIELLRGDSWVCWHPESLSVRALKKLFYHHPKNRRGSSLQCYQLNLRVGAWSGQ